MYLRLQALVNRKKEAGIVFYCGAGFLFVTIRHECKLKL